MKLNVENTDHRTKEVRLGGISRMIAPETTIEDVEVDWDDFYMDHLESCGLVLHGRPEPEPEPEVAKSAPGVTGEEREAVIRGIMKSLPLEGFSKTDLPKLNAVNAELPPGTKPIDAAERDALWAEVKDA